VTKSLYAIPESLPELAEALRSNELQLRDYLHLLEYRFADIEPAIHAFMPEPARFARLRAEAEALEEKWPAPADRPPLFGVAVGVKDIMRVDGMPTTAGSQLPLEEFEGPESACVSTLREAGALILGKTVSTEFAYFGPGPTRNPRNIDHTPGGSSSGSAAAVAAGLSPLTLGTQTIGSLIRPAAFCGVVAFKPSYDRISKQDVIPLSPSLDHVGLFTSDVAGAALAASLLCSNWRPVERPGSFAIGLPTGPYLDSASEEGRRHFDSVVEALRTAGYELKSVPAFADYTAIQERHNLIMAAEAAHVHAQWFAKHGQLYHPKTKWLVEQGQATSGEMLARALLGREALRAELTALMDSAGIDAWLAPSAPGAAPRGLDSTGDPVMNLPWTHSGLPVVGMPAGRNEAGLPLGVQLIGRWMADENVLAWAEGLSTILTPPAGPAATE
jgi:Asp-tRNA(Asn)/Glu-tRNA(Gln) amidotransferase A subunit family amidase